MPPLSTRPTSSSWRGRRDSSYGISTLLDVLNQIVDLAVVVTTLAFQVHLFQLTDQIIRL